MLQHRCWYFSSFGSLCFQVCWVLVQVVFGSVQLDFWLCSTLFAFSLCSVSPAASWSRAAPKRLSAAAWACSSIPGLVSHLHGCYTIVSFFFLRRWQKGGRVSLRLSVWVPHCTSALLRLLAFIFQIVLVQTEAIACTQSPQHHAEEL